MQRSLYGNSQLEGGYMIMINNNKYSHTSALYLLDLLDEHKEIIGEVG